MKIQYCSDLHLEFKENNNYVTKHPIQPEGEVLLLAGDILPFVLNPLRYSFFDVVSEQFEAVYWVPGNHEYYGFDIGKLNNPLFEKVRNNVFLVNNHTIQHKEVNIICSTLWSHIQPQNEWVIQKSLTDFSAISFNDAPLLPYHFNAFHQSALAFLTTEFNNHKDEKNVVLTHHVPTLLNYPPKFKKSVLSEAFAVELHDLIADAGNRYWIYGHHHSNIAPFAIGATAMLTNQLGYVKNHEHRSYRKNAVFEI